MGQNGGEMLKKISPGPEESGGVVAWRRGVPAFVPAADGVSMQREEWRR